MNKIIDLEFSIKAYEILEKLSDKLRITYHHVITNALDLYEMFQDILEKDKNIYFSPDNNNIESNLSEDRIKTKGNIFNNHHEFIFSHENQFEEDPNEVMIVPLIINNQTFQKLEERVEKAGYDCPSYIIGEALSLYDNVIEAIDKKEYLYTTNGNNELLKIKIKSYPLKLMPN